MSFFRKRCGPWEADASSQAEGIKVVRAFYTRILHLIVRFIPMLPSMRGQLHRWRGVRVGKDIHIGTNVFIDDARPESIVIEDEATIIAGTMILGHARYPRHFQSVLTDNWEGVCIKKGSYIGAKALILPGVTVGCCAVVAAGAIVNRDVPDFTMVAGVPAKVIKTFEAERFENIFKENGS